MVWIVHSLVAKKNALNGYGESYVGMKVTACREYVGNVNGRIGGLRLAYNFSGGGGYLVHSIVIVDNTLDSDCHTNLNTKVGNRILCHIVSVVAALAACVSEEEVVSLTTGGFGVNCNNDTFNCNGIAFLASHILVVAEHLELRYVAYEILGYAVSVRILNSSGKNVINLLIGLAGNNYGIEGAVFFLNGNFGVINGPLNRVFYSANHNGSNYVVACCGCRLFRAVHTPKKINSVLKIPGNLRLFSTLVRGLVFRDVLEACGEHTEAHH